MIVHNAVYTSGHRIDFGPLEQTYETCQRWGGFVWIDLYEPTRQELNFVAEAFGLHPLAVEYAAKNYQWSKTKHYNETLFVVLKPARYVESTQTIVFGEIQAVTGPHFITTLRYGEASELHNVLQLVKRKPEWLPRGPSVILHVVADQVVDDYSLVVADLQNALEEIRIEVFSNPNVLPRIHKLYREALKLRMEARLLIRILGRLAEEEGLAIGPETHWYPRNIQGRLLRAMGNIEGFCKLLSNILRMNFASTGMNKDRPSWLKPRRRKKRHVRFW